MSQDGAGGGEWLSRIRNAVNYQHEFGAWYPYQNAKHTTEDLIRISESWTNDPDAIYFPKGEDKILQFIRLSASIVSLCNAIVKDMEQNISNRRHRSFHCYGSLALIQHANR